MTNGFDFEFEFSSKAEAVNAWLIGWISELRQAIISDLAVQINSIEYSLCAGGKRFRPVLGLAVAEAYRVPEQLVLPWVCSVEMIHTYSLVHDDLPCMDNDDYRRGKPTNHKVFGEDIALLSGDALLTHAFQVVAKHYKADASVGIDLIQLLTSAAGLTGMIGGQVIDMKAKVLVSDMNGLKQMHKMKTGALIAAPVTGVCRIAGLGSETTNAMTEFGHLLGLAFQIADDILDDHEQGQDQRSYTRFLGLDEAKKELMKVSEQALSRLDAAKCKSSFLKQLVQYNIDRKL